MKIYDEFGNIFEAKKLGKKQPFQTVNDRQNIESFTLDNKTVGNLSSCGNQHYLKSLTGEYLKFEDGDINYILSQNSGDQFVRLFTKPYNLKVAILQ